jgi:glucose/mannose-6-phosphate isomerase
LQGADDYIKIKERYEILKEYFKINHINFREVFSIKGSILSKLITLVYLFDYTSVYLAALSKVDPSPVSSIDFIKQRIDK